MNKFIFGFATCTVGFGGGFANADNSLPNQPALLSALAGSNFELSYEADYNVFKQRAKGGFVAATTDANDHRLGLHFRPDGLPYFAVEFSFLQTDTEDDTAPIGFAQGDRLKSQSYSMRALTELELSDWTVMPSVELGFDDYQFERRDLLTASTAFSDTTGWHVTTDVEVYTTFPLANNLWLSPSFKLEHTYTYARAFNEAGAGFSNLSIGPISDHRVQSQIGMTVFSTVMTGGGSSVSPFATAKWLHNFITDPVNVSAGLVAGGPRQNTAFLVGPDRDGILLNGGVFVETGGGAEVYLAYEGEFFDTSTSHSVSSYLKIPF